MEYPYKKMNVVTLTYKSVQHDLVLLMFQKSDQPVDTVDERNPKQPPGM